MDKIESLTLFSTLDELTFKGIVWFKHLFSEISVENIDMDFLADLASLMPKLMIKKKKWPSPYVKWFPRGRSRGGLFPQIFDKSLTRVNIDFFL